ncbi:MAG: hypothetical protein DCC52_11385, partial [Chloroflexi bacterium]
ADWARNYVADLGGNDFLLENVGLMLFPAMNDGDAHGHDAFWHDKGAHDWSACFLSGFACGARRSLARAFAASENDVASSNGLSK